MAKFEKILKNYFEIVDTRYVVDTPKSDGKQMAKYVLTVKQ